MPNLNSLSELEYIYYQVGFSYIENLKSKSKADVVKHYSKEIVQLVQYFSYQLADLKNLLYDISSTTRGLGGVKQPFNISQLPSSRRTKEKQSALMTGNQNETQQQKLQRHKKFFNQLKRAFASK